CTLRLFISSYWSTDLDGFISACHFSCRVCTMFMSFPLSCSGDHPELHSFPTRRSSDLAVEEAENGSHALYKIVGQKADLMFMFRSEEHTSELQSRFDLVCRLLLEKKK